MPTSTKNRQNSHGFEQPRPERHGRAVAGDDRADDRHRAREVVQRPKAPKSSSHGGSDAPWPCSVARHRAESNSIAGTARSAPITERTDAIVSPSGRPKRTTDCAAPVSSVAIRLNVSTRPTQPATYQRHHQRRASPAARDQPTVAAIAAASASPTALRDASSLGAGAA